MSAGFAKLIILIEVGRSAQIGISTDDEINVTSIFNLAPVRPHLFLSLFVYYLLLVVCTLFHWLRNRHCTKKNF